MGSCNKPGGMGSKPSMSQLRKMQEHCLAIRCHEDAMMKMDKPGQKSGTNKETTGSQSQGLTAKNLQKWLLNSNI